MMLIPLRFPLGRFMAKFIALDPFLEKAKLVISNILIGVMR